jgi:L-iditol 2-dehydrogenase
MKAAVLYGNDDIRYDEWTTPNVKPGLVKIRVRVSGICGSDVPRVLHNGAHYYPIVLGHEFSGDIVEIGASVNNVNIGDKVVGAPLIPCMNCKDCQIGNYSLCKHYSFIGSREAGSFAEYIVIPAQNAVKIDDVISYEEAVFCEPSTVALHGVRCVNFLGGEDVAILGCGNIGIFILQWVRIFGAKNVVIFDIDVERLNLAKKMGANKVVNTLNEDYISRTSEITNGMGFGYIFEAAGNANTIKMAFELSGNKAQVCLVGTPHGDVCLSMKEWENINRKEFYLTGSWMSYSAPFPGKEWELTSHYLSTGQLLIDEDLIFMKFPLADVSKAFDLYKKPQQVQGKILLMVD